jgi:hypothetical protein
MVAFADAVPSMRIAVDLKVELFRNPAKPWSMNSVHDIDALSMAVPYCHVVVPDREMASLLARSGAGLRYGTKFITSLSGLPGALLELTEQARNAPGGQTGWDWAGPWDGYCQSGWRTQVARCLGASLGRFLQRPERAVCLSFPGEKLAEEGKALSEPIVFSGLCRL